MNDKAKMALGGLVALALAGGISVVMLGDDDPLDDPGGGTGGVVVDGSSDGGGDGSVEFPTDGSSDGRQPVGSDGGSGGATGSSGGTGTGSDPRQPVGGNPRIDDPVTPRNDGQPVSVEFRCTDADGQPLAGVFIEARRRSGAPLPSAQSDAGGVARIGGLPEGEVISGVGRHAISSDGATFGPVTVGARTVVKLTFNRSEQGRILGTIMDDQGSPVDQGELILVDPRAEGKAVLDALAIALRADGSFAANVASGTYTVSARSPGYTESDRTYVKVEPNADAGPVQLIVHRAGSIEGTVKLSGGFDSQLPLDLDIVCEVKGGSDANPYTRTRREPLKVDRLPADYSIADCEPGRYRIRLEVVEAGAKRVGPWAVVQLTSGQHVTGLTLTLAEVMVAVQGTVRDDRGLPLRGVRVTVGKVTVRSDENGAYAVRGLDLGETAVEAKSKKHAPFYKAIDYTGSQQTVEIELKRFGAIRGRIVTRKAGVPVLAVLREEDGVRDYETTTKGSGTFIIGNLPPGSYYMKAGPGASAFEDANAPTVIVSPAEVVISPDVYVEE